MDGAAGKCRHEGIDANDWIYQTWAYERHDVGTTAGFVGDTAKALSSIKARTLILTGTKDLLNPEFEPIAMGKNIPRVKMVTISPGTVTGHAAAAGSVASDVHFLDQEIGAFLRDGLAHRRRISTTLAQCVCATVFQGFAFGSTDTAERAAAG
ncbi:hypothetical protein [Bradyrhizobium betae]|uniref:hypothetical protein n=1 Tax=Bradyrhizobium betae TaxID=244734 RepID=UPI001FCEE0E0|nr:hypothetical protein [Bradyrhizobium betae]MCS3727235.1 homoserine acetyltransferase [Bradyrhizobium betae]